VASRIAAYRAIRRVHDGGAWSSRAVDAELARGELDARDRAFAANLAYETLRWEGTLDWALSHVSTRSLDAVQPEVLDVLRLGAWQLLKGRQPDRAAVGTAVDVAREDVSPHVTGFVNGVLRALVRRRAELPWPGEDSDAGLGLALGYPAWVVAEARARFGQRAGAVLEAGNAPPGLTLRAVGDRAALLAELRDAGVEAEAGEHAPEAVRARGADPARLEAVASGRAVVQDEASMLVARTVMAAGEPQGLVADLCAGPGGKTTHLAQLGATVVAGDVRRGRARLVREAADRLGPGIGGRVHVVVADAARPAQRPGAFDAVLLDAPCTGLGVVRRRPEVRWRIGPGDPGRLGELQLRLLVAAVGLLAPGGRLVYSVCTWTTAETAAVARRVGSVAGDLVEAVDLPAGPGSRLPGDPGRQLSPDVDGVDGMYVLTLRRRARTI
jgi:16S rRNA (cytosine967-C5)-methyltransferase